MSILLALAGTILSYVVQKKAEQEFQKVNGTFSSLSINLFTRSVTVNHIVWQTPVDSFPHKAIIGKIQLRGISFFQLLFSKQLYARTLLIDSGSVQFNPSQKRDSTRVHQDNSFSFEIENVILNNIFAEIKRDSLTEMEGLFNLRYGTLKIESLDEIHTACKSVFKYFNGDVTNLKINKRGGYYTSKIDKIEFDSHHQSIYIDSLRLIPNYDKYEFATIAGRQVSRLNLIIKRIEVEGLNYHKLFDSLVSIRKISIDHVNLHSFRDKRVPLQNKKIVPMPMTSLSELSFALEVDSIAIDDSMITVEEFAPLALRPGYINFQKLNAVLVGLSNRYYNNKPQFAQLNASAMIMGDGLITASFRLPLDGSPLYSAKGKVSNFSLPKLNTILENSAQVRIESGKLNELFFNFNYTDFKSTGTIEINYENLKLTMLNSDKEKSTDRLKTVVLNALLKKTKDESIEQAKRQGTIEAERDRQRFVFNLWWKSLQSGLKSSVVGNDKK